MKPRGGEGQNGRLKCPMGFLVVYVFTLYFWIISLTGNYNDSLSDAKLAIDLQPSYIKAIVRGKFS